MISFDNMVTNFIAYAKTAIKFNNSKVKTSADFRKNQLIKHKKYRYIMQEPLTYAFGIKQGPTTQLDHVQEKEGNIVPLKNFHTRKEKKNENLEAHLENFRK